MGHVPVGGGIQLNQLSHFPNWTALFQDSLWCYFCLCRTHVVFVDQTHSPFAIQTFSHRLLINVVWCANLFIEMSSGLSGRSIGARIRRMFWPVSAAKVMTLQMELLWGFECIDGLMAKHHYHNRLCPNTPTRSQVNYTRVH